MPSTAPTVNQTGGGATGGQLAPGTYFVTYGFTNTAGAETFASPPSATFTVVAGDIPVVTLPPLPIGMTGYSLYLSDNAADPSSATLYASGILTKSISLANAATTGLVRPQVPNAPTTAPMVQAIGGGLTGGQLAPGTYFVYYTTLSSTGAESFASPSSAPFTVASGSIPQVQLPPIPAGAVGFNLYLSDTSADVGSATRYALDITATTYLLRNASTMVGLVTPSRAGASTPASVSPSGGGSTGGHLAPGTYFLQYTFTYPGGTETLPSPGSNSFTVTASGNVPAGHAAGPADRGDRLQFVPLQCLGHAGLGRPLCLGDDVAPVQPLGRHARRGDRRAGPR